MLKILSECNGSYSTSQVFLVMFLLSFIFECESKTLQAERHEIVEINNNNSIKSSNEIVVDREKVHHNIVRHADQQPCDGGESASDERKDIKQSEGSIKQANVKDRFHHVIVKRHAAPDPRPKGGGSPSGRTKQKGHKSLNVRHALEVGTVGQAFTGIALTCLFVVIVVSIYYYWNIDLKLFKKMDLLFCGIE